jgi:uncharacterized protein involved in exopolysaccharide biosynthesis/Mrp family chromosome partitioning ATPase
VSRELRIRDSYAGQGGRGLQGEVPDAEDSHFRDESSLFPPQSEPHADQGETAWDLPEPSFDPIPEPTGIESRSESQDESFPNFPGFPGMGAGEEEAPPKGPGLDLERLARGIIKRLWLVMGITFGISGLAVVVAVTLIKPKWEAAAAVVVHTRQDQFSLGAAKPFELQNYNLKTMLDTIKLPNALLAVIETLKLEATPRALSPAIGVNVGKESNIFQITATWKDPVNAAAIANKVAELLVQRSRDMRRKEAEDAHANYSAQLEKAREAHRNLIDELRAFKASRQVSDFSAETQVLLGSLSSLETELSTKVAEVEAYKDSLAEIEKAVKGEPEMMVTSTVYRNPLKNRLSDYEWQLQEARSRYTEQNPKVIKLQTRVDVLKQMIAESKDEGAPENLYSANTKLTEMQTRQRELTSELRVREAQIEALTRTIAQNRAKLNALTSAEKDFQFLQARMTAAENLVTGLVGRVDEAEVLMRRDEATLELFEAARPPAEAAASPKKLIAIVGVVLGGVMGLGVALVLELLDPLMRTRRDGLGIPRMAFAWEFQQVPEGSQGVVAIARPTDPIATHFRRFINELDVKLEAEDWRCLGITSATPGVGRTLAATNLAQAMAIKEYQVILVDADLRRSAGPHPADLLGLPPDQAGLRQALRGDAPVASLLTATRSPELTLLTVGFSPSHLALESQRRDDPDTAPPPSADPVPDWEAEQPADPDLVGLGSRQFRTICDTLQQTGCHIIYDLPPLGAQETVLEAAAGLVNLLLVVRSGHSTRQQLREAVDSLEERGAKVHGVLVTDVPFELLDGKPLFPHEPKPRRRWFRQPKTQAPDAPDPQPVSESHAS